MKRYNYQLWFKKIMDAIPIKIVRVLVFLILCIGIFIGACCESLAKTFNRFTDRERFKETIGDVWHWEERGDSQNGKYH